MSNDRLLTLEEEGEAREKWRRLAEATRPSWRDYWLSRQADLAASLVRKEIGECMANVLGEPVTANKAYQQGLVPVSELRELRRKLRRFCQALQQGKRPEE